MAWNTGHPLVEEIHAESVVSHEHCLGGRIHAKYPNPPIAEPLFGSRAHDRLAVKWKRVGADRIRIKLAPVSTYASVVIEATDKK